MVVMMRMHEDNGPDDDDDDDDDDDSSLAVVVGVACALHLQLVGHGLKVPARPHLPAAPTNSDKRRRQDRQTATNADVRAWTQRSMEAG
jgi:hypothetical protein